MALRYGVLAAMLLLAGCTEPPGRPLPAHGLGADSPAALVNGQVIGDPASGCVWIDSPSGGRLSASWPPGYRVSFEPLVIYDDAGEQVATAGITYGFGGGHVGDASALPEPCRTTRTWTITSITPTDPP